MAVSEVAGCREAAGTAFFQVAIGVVVIGALLAMLGFLFLMLWQAWREMRRW